ncbi:MAG: GrpB family protein [Pseudomonadota bacterium]
MAGTRQVMIPCAREGCHYARIDPLKGVVSPGILSLPFATNGVCGLKIELSDYQSVWPTRFEAEKALLLRIANPWTYGGVEHVGSTAVVGMVTKPIIDIMLGVRDLESSKPAIEVLEAHEYCYYPYREGEMHWFCKPSTERRTHHLHLVPFKSALWEARIRFRDALRSQPAVAQRYTELKRRLVESSRGDREKYTEMKGPFIQSVLQSLTA